MARAFAPSERAAFIGAAVAVVIQPVTDLFAGALVREALEGASGALLAAGRTDPRLAGRTARAAAGVAFIGAAVTVIIQTIAELGAG